VKRGVPNWIILALVMLPLNSAGQAQAPWFGIWKMDFAQSTGHPETRFRKVTSRIEPWKDGLKVTYDAVGVRGGVMHMEWRGRFDGRDYPVQGVDYVLTNAYSRIDDHTYQIVIKVDGAAAATARVVISLDGKTLTTVTTEKKATTTAVYEKQ